MLWLLLSFILFRKFWIVPIINIGSEEDVISVESFSVRLPEEIIYSLKFKYNSYILLYLYITYNT